MPSFPLYFSPVHSAKSNSPSLFQDRIYSLEICLLCLPFSVQGGYSTIHSIRLALHFALAYNWQKVLPREGLNMVTRLWKRAFPVILMCTLFLQSVLCLSFVFAEDQELLTGTHYVEIQVKDYGTIEAELYADLAPATVTNFLHLAENGFYDGLTFHRIIAGFMIQGGDPNGNGTGGSGTNIPGEFAANGFPNPLAHTRGVLSMARARAYDSASSQFFICHADSPHLDGSYAAFGRVISGMEVVDAICSTTPVTDRNGTVRKENQPVILKIIPIEKPDSASIESNP